MPYASESADFSIALGGDCMLTRPLKIHDEADFLAVAALFQKSDVGFVNLETVVRRWDEGGPGITRGTYMTTAPELLDDLKWFGVNLVSCANNHIFDYGEGGLLATMKHLAAAGLAQAGIGQNLAEARMPAYADTRAGRVALVAATGTFYPWHAASHQRPDMAGRPGSNPLHSERTYSVDAESYRALKRLSRELGFDQGRARDRQHFFNAAEAPPEDSPELHIFGERFVHADGFGMAQIARAGDLEENLRSVREARRQADWVVVSLHSHDFSHRSVREAERRTELNELAEYVSEFAHAAIDAGADVFVGHGSHTPLGIEIYKGKPIFHSVGNVIFQTENVPRFPAHAYERFGLDARHTPADFLDARSDGGKKGQAAHAGFWENIVATCRFRAGKLADIRVVPIEQGFGRSRGERGRPLLAKGETADRIIARVAKLSQPYGVGFRTEDGVGVVSA